MKYLLQYLDVFYSSNRYILQICKPSLFLWKYHLTWGGPGDEPRLCEPKMLIDLAQVLSNIQIYPAIYLTIIINPSYKITYYRSINQVIYLIVSTKLVDVYFIGSHNLGEWPFLTRSSDTFHTKDGVSR